MKLSKNPKNIAILLVFCMLFGITGCGQKAAVAVPTPAEAVSPAPTDEAEPTATAAPTDTPEPTAEPTDEAEPTAIPAEGEDTPAPTRGLGITVPNPTENEEPTGTEEPTPTESAEPTASEEPTEPVITEAPVTSAPVPTSPGADDIVGVLTVEGWNSEIVVTKAPVRCDYVVANVPEYVNVRSGPGTEYEIVGKLRVDGYGLILERLNDWTKIVSGNVEGYVANYYLYFDQEAIDILNTKKAFTVVIDYYEMNVRKEPNAECEIVGTARKNEEYVWHPELSTDLWLAIEYKDLGIAYVREGLALSKTVMKPALTLAEDKKQMRAELFEKAKAYSAAHPHTTVMRNHGITLTEEEKYLMAVVVASEALWEPYEGKLMVANVIINRMLNGYWGRTLTEVVYAKGQFEGSDTGRFDLMWNQVSADCLRAVDEALAGKNNVGDYIFFIANWAAEWEYYNHCYVYYGHCFYDRTW